MAGFSPDLQERLDELDRELEVCLVPLPDLLSTYLPLGLTP